LKRERPRFDPVPQQHEELLQRFLQASSRGDMEGLLALISKEIVLYADGGGKATAVPNPIYGAENVVTIPDRSSKTNCCRWIWLGTWHKSMEKQLLSAISMDTT